MNPRIFAIHPTTDFDWIGLLAPTASKVMKTW